MIEIIEHGNKRMHKCNVCGCKFLYSKEDTECFQCGYNEYEYRLKCPDCESELVVE